MTAKEFREYAEEHFGWAKTARWPKDGHCFSPIGYSGPCKPARLPHGEA